MGMIPKLFFVLPFISKMNQLISLKWYIVGVCKLMYRPVIWDIYAKFRKQIANCSQLIFTNYRFDKLRREWQMHRGFVTATQLLNPDVTFFLGDLFDEGKWASEQDFTGKV